VEIVHVCDVAVAKGVVSDRPEVKEVGLPSVEHRDRKESRTADRKTARGPCVGGGGTVPALDLQAAKPR
jgi:hypothetical protein